VNSTDAIACDGIVPSPLYTGGRVRVRGGRENSATQSSAPHPCPPALSPDYRGEGERLREIYYSNYSIAYTNTLKLLASVRDLALER
jgi:hypothetical protein